MPTVIHNRHGCTECFVVWNSPLGRSRIIISLTFSFYATVLMVTDFITKRSCGIVCCICFGNLIILHNNLLREIIIDKPAPSCIIFKSESNHAPPSYYTERYRSGHNGADSKFRRKLGTSSPWFSLIFLNTENLKIEYFLPSLLFSLQRIFEQISGKKTGRK